MKLNSEIKDFTFSKPQKKAQTQTMSAVHTVSSRVAHYIREDRKRKSSGKRIGADVSDDKAKGNVEIVRENVKECAVGTGIE
jgi:hypothetical protein